MPTFSYDRWPADHIRIEYTEQGLGIHPCPKANCIYSGGGEEAS